MIQHRNVLTLGAIAGLIFIAGCATTSIKYKPLAAAAPSASTGLSLKVVDQRPADKGGQDKTQVGQIRGSYGIPSGVNDGSADVAPRTVTEATTDALKQAGVSVQSGSPKTLVATVTHYWMDGFQGYKATVGVQYALQDGGGKTLWSAEVKGGAGGTNLFRSPQSFTQEMFENALTDLANKSAEQFKSEAFKKALTA